MNEQVLTFGEDNRLTGVITPTTPEMTAEPLAPVLIILSAGIVHRIGPHRLHVKLARRAASLGFPTLRFDLSGLGESLPAAPGIGYEAQAVADTRAAIAQMQAVFGSRTIILAGLCSGADNAYRAALEDEAVTGLILLDPYAYENRSAKIAYLAKRAQDPEKLMRFVGNLPNKLMGTDRAGQLAYEPTPDGQEDPDNDRIPPPRAAFGRDLEKLASRGTEMCLVYTHSVHHCLNRPEHFFATFSEFDFRDRITVFTAMDATHTFSTLESQGKLLTALEGWLKRFSG